MKIPYWVYIVAALLLAGLLVIFLTLYQRRRIRRSALKPILPVRKTRQPSTLTLPNLGAIALGPRTFSYAELRDATDAFSKDNLLGQGGFGCVYKGVIREAPHQSQAEAGHSLTVAIKRMAKNSKQGEREFQAEVLSVGRLRHRNLASLLGWCQERDELLLVYEFMAKGSLDQHLYRKAGHPALPWSARLHILRGIAAALEYLHGGWDKCILHRDIKPSNILLDAHMTARLGDFGLARLAGHTIVSRDSGLWTNIVGGTMGYMAPEVFLYGQLTKKADIFSFGMVALEMVCGRRPAGFPVEANDNNTDNTHNKNNTDNTDNSNNNNTTDKEVQNLMEWVWTAHKKGQLLDVMDPSLREFPGIDSYELQQQVTTVLHLGMVCTHVDPSSRPPTSHLTQALSGNRSIPLPSSRWDWGAARMVKEKDYGHCLGARRYTYAELEEATNGFSRCRHLVQGSQGDVYRGSLLDSNDTTQEVAIKRLAPNSRGEEFHTEILNLVGLSRHRNLLALLGWCYEKDDLFLVYEYMENGFLADHLYDNKARTLPWASKFKILQEVATAMDYIHNGCEENNWILHRHIKPSNVMLDEHMVAKLTDFGLSLIMEGVETSESDSPYIAPELISGGWASATMKSDVYSFGMMALEMVFGRPLTTREDILKWAWNMHERGKLDASLGSACFQENNVTDDEALRKQEDSDLDVVMQKQIVQVLQLGMLCCLPEANFRPHSHQLLQALCGEWNVSENVSLLNFMPRCSKNAISP